MGRIVVAFAASGVLGAFGAWLVLTNSYPDEGPWVPISKHHGIHVGDVVIVAIWAVVTWALLRWARVLGVHSGR